MESRPVTARMPSLENSVSCPVEGALIVARATGAGTAAIAIVRIDGAGCAPLVERLFVPAAPQAGGPVSRPRTMVFGHWIDPTTGEAIDDGLCVFFPSPASYTGNDLAEFHCHGGPIPPRRLVEAVLNAGARMARPGEFTRRAFLNGRMDLAQAEAVADLVNAQTDAAARAARRQLAGALSARIVNVRERLLEAAAHIEAYIDFPEDDIEPADRQAIATQLHQAREEIGRLLRPRRRGHLLREGARVVLTGLPNAGKSSLLNALVRKERAIVTPHPGTTRDMIECMIDLAGVPLTLIDTAGLREVDDPVERLGVERTRRELEQADMVVFVRDTSQPHDPHEERLALAGIRPDVVALNKVDLLQTPPRVAGGELPVSATRGDGLDRLEAAILVRLHAGDASAAEEIVSQRHAQLLERAGQAVDAAVQVFARDPSGELVMIDVREALESLSEILGLDEIRETLLDRIFSRFCLGK